MAHTFDAERIIPALDLIVSTIPSIETLNPSELKYIQTFCGVTDDDDVTQMTIESIQEFVADKTKWAIDKILAVIHAPIKGLMAIGDKLDALSLSIAEPIVGKSIDAKTCGWIMSATAAAAGIGLAFYLKIPQLMTREAQLMSDLRAAGIGAPKLTEYETFAKAVGDFKNPFGVFTAQIKQGAKRVSVEFKRYQDGPKIIEAGGGEITASTIGQLKTLISGVAKVIKQTASRILSTAGSIAKDALSTFADAASIVNTRAVKSMDFKQFVAYARKSNRPRYAAAVKDLIRDMRSEIRWSLNDAIKEKDLIITPETLPATAEYRRRAIERLRGKIRAQYKAEFQPKFTKLKEDFLAGKNINFKGPDGYTHSLRRLSDTNLIGFSKAVALILAVVGPSLAFLTKVFTEASDSIMNAIRGLPKKDA